MRKFDDEIYVELAFNEDSDLDIEEFKNRVDIGVDQYNRCGECGFLLDDDHYTEYANVHDELPYNNVEYLTDGYICPECGDTDSF